MKYFTHILKLNLRILWLNIEIELLKIAIVAKEFLLNVLSGLCEFLLGIVAVVTGERNE